MALNQCLLCARSVSQDSGGGAQASGRFIVCLFVLLFNQYFLKASQVIWMCRQDWEPALGDSGREPAWTPLFFYYTHRDRFFPLNELPWVTVLSSTSATLSSSFCLVWFRKRKRKKYSYLLLISTEIPIITPPMWGLLLFSWNLHRNPVILL